MKEKGWTPLHKTLHFHRRKKEGGRGRSAATQRRLHGGGGRGKKRKEKGKKCSGDLLHPVLILQGEMINIYLAILPTKGREKGERKGEEGGVPVTTPTLLSKRDLHLGDAPRQYFSNPTFGGGEKGGMGGGGGGVCFFFWGFFWFWGGEERDRARSNGPLHPDISAKGREEEGGGKKEMRPAMWRQRRAHHKGNPLGHPTWPLPAEKKERLVGYSAAPLRQKGATLCWHSERRETPSSLFFGGGSKKRGKRAPFSLIFPITPGDEKKKKGKGRRKDTSTFFAYLDPKDKEKKERGERNGR